IEYPLQGSGTNGSILVLIMTEQLSVAVRISCAGTGSVQLKGPIGAGLEFQTGGMISLRMITTSHVSTLPQISSTSYVCVIVSGQDPPSEIVETKEMFPSGIVHGKLTTPPAPRKADTV